MKKITVNTTIGELIPEGDKCEGDKGGDCLFLGGGYWEDFYCIIPGVTGEIIKGQKVHDCPKPPGEVKKLAGQ